MARIILLVCAISTFFMAGAETFVYRFSSTPLPVAIQRIMADHTSLDINFIYNELENYYTSANVNAENAYDAIRQTIGLNPVTVVKANDTYYIEALQHGKYVFSGRAVGSDKEPVAAATVFLLAPRDSSIITFGVTDDSGRFSIPCDRQKVIAKLCCMGYRTTYCLCNTFDIGAIIMPEQAVNLDNVSVEADNAHLYADRSVFIPTARQKNASQTGVDLLSHMALPQLGLISGSDVSTNSGKHVDIFIDYLPASESDLRAMRTEDVKKVEYYQFPSDPRFQGDKYVINFVMQKYEYGGYIKTFGHTNLISNPVGELLSNIRLQHKNMTYDIMGST